MKRLALLVLAGLAAGCADGAAAWAQDFPTRPITLIVPWPAGGAVDTICRALAQPKLSERLGKPVVIENRPGGGSVSAPRPAPRPRPTATPWSMAGQRLDGDQRRPCTSRCRTIRPRISSPMALVGRRFRSC